MHHAASQVRVTVSGEDDCVRLTVDDDGPGVPAAERARIFEPFVRLEASRSRSAGGHGLGLAIVARLVRASRGRYRVETSPAGGARFIVELPRSGSRTQTRGGALAPGDRSFRQDA
ncbi:MAG: ATP-binding protein [Myxococcota bacterium]